MISFVAAAAVIAGLAAEPSTAGEPSLARTGVIQLAQTEPQKPLQAVIKSIRKRVPGRALDARVVDRDGRQAYQIKWIGQNGRVHDITADAKSGKIVKIR
jgi:uncharacterized membrane protein YkoI